MRRLKRDYYVLIQREHVAGYLRTDYKRAAMQRLPDVTNS